MAMKERTKLFLIYAASLAMCAFIYQNISVAGQDQYKQGSKYPSHSSYPNHVGSPHHR